MGESSFVEYVSHRARAGQMEADVKGPTPRFEKAENALLRAIRENANYRNLPDFLVDRRFAPHVPVLFIPQSVSLEPQTHGVTKLMMLSHAGFLSSTNKQHFITLSGMHGILDREEKTLKLLAGGPAELEELRDVHVAFASSYMFDEGPCPLLSRHTLLRETTVQLPAGGRSTSFPLFLLSEPLYTPGCAHESSLIWQPAKSARTPIEQAQAGGESSHAQSAPSSPRSADGRLTRGKSPETHESHPRRNSFSNTSPESFVAQPQPPTVEGSSGRGEIFGSAMSYIVPSKLRSLFQAQNVNSVPSNSPQSASGGSLQAPASSGPQIVGQSPPSATAVSTRESAASPVDNRHPEFTTPPTLAQGSVGHIDDRRTEDMTAGNLGGASFGASFQAFLEKMRDRSASEIVISIKNFTKAFCERPVGAAPLPYGVKEHERVREFLQQTERAIAALPMMRGAGSEELDGVSESLEKYVCTKIYPRAFCPTPEDAEEDAKLDQQIRRHAFVRPEHLEMRGVGPADEPHWTRAAAELQKMSQYKSPRDKIVCVLNCCKIVGAIVAHRRGSGTGADEFLPALIYAVLRANPPALHSNIEFINRYRNPARLGGESAYYLTALASAASFVKSLNETCLDIPHATYLRELKNCSGEVADATASSSAPSGEPPAVPPGTTEPSSPPPSGLSASLSSANADTSPIPDDDTIRSLSSANANLFSSNGSPAVTEGAAHGLLGDTNTAPVAVDRDSVAVSASGDHVPDEGDLLDLSTPWPPQESPEAPTVLQPLTPIPGPRSSPNFTPKPLVAIPAAPPARPSNFLSTPTQAMDGVFSLPSPDGAHAASNLGQRFYAARAEDLRIGDIGALLAEYRQMAALLSSLKIV